MASWGDGDLAEAAPGPHKCPGPRCKGEADVPADQLMCRADWYAVPKPVRSAVWRTYLRGPGSAAHRAAMGAAIRAATGHD